MFQIFSVEACKETENGRDLSELIYKVCSRVISGDVKANSVIRCLQDVIVSKYKSMIHVTVV